MKKYKIAPENLEKFLYQNRAEVIDCIEGCLLDNLLCYTRRGILFLKEHYLNCWSSDYQVFFVPFNATKGEHDDIFQAFEALRTA